MSDQGIRAHILAYHRVDLDPAELDRRFTSWVQFHINDIGEWGWQQYHDNHLHFETEYVLGYKVHTHAHMPVIGTKHDDNGEPMGLHVIKQPEYEVEAMDTLPKAVVPMKWIVKTTGNQTKKQMMFEWIYDGCTLMTGEPIVPDKSGFRILEFGIIPQPTMSVLND